LIQFGQRRSAGPMDLLACATAVHHSAAWPRCTWTTNFPPATCGSPVDLDHSKPPIYHVMC
jgi:hypothetical protein